MGFRLHSLPLKIAVGTATALAVVVGYWALMLPLPPDEPSEIELRLRQTLESVEFHESRFDDAIQKIGQLAGVPIAVDWDTLDDFIGPHERVSLTLRQVSAERALREVITNRRRWTPLLRIRENDLLITAEYDKTNESVQLHNVSDLLESARGFSSVMERLTPTYARIPQTQPTCYPDQGVEPTPDELPIWGELCPFVRSWGDHLLIIAPREEHGSFERVLALLRTERSLSRGGIP